LPDEISWKPVNITRPGIGLLLALAATHAADDRPRLRPLPSEGRNAKTGPSVGARIPGFDTVDSTGRRQTFETLRGPKGLVLLFARSADWSLPCQTQILDLDRHAAAFRRKGLGVAALTFDSVAVLQNFARKQNLTIPLLSDTGSSVIKAFGLLNGNPDPSAPAFGVPFPGTYIIDERGVVTARYFDDDPAERFTASAILAHELLSDAVSDVVAANVAANVAARDASVRNVIETPQLTLTWSASDSTVTPGSRIALILDIEPKPKMRILAPGAQGFIPLEWQMGASKAWIAFPLPYPAGRSLRLPGVIESLPVYDRRIRLVRDVAVGQANEIAASLTPDRNLSVEGSFRFQACDEKECFPPRSLLVRWNLRAAEIAISLRPGDPLQ
jgi:peroxiredoxin